MFERGDEAHQIWRALASGLKCDVFPSYIFMGFFILFLRDKFLVFIMSHNRALYDPSHLALVVVVVVVRKNGQ